MINKCKYHSKCEHIGEECYEPFASQCVFYKRFEEELELGIGAITIVPKGLEDKLKKEKK